MDGGGCRRPPARVDFIGPQLEGLEQFAAAAGVGGHVYVIPGTSAARTMRIDGKTGQTQLLGPEVVGELSYLAAVVVEDCIYGIPFSAPRILRIHCSSGEAGLVGPELRGARKYWCAGVVGRCIFAIPCDAQRVMRIDCDTSAVDFVGPELPGEFKYVAAAAVGDCVYAPPCAGASRVLRVRGSTGEVDLIGPDLVAAGNGKRVGVLKYATAAVVGQHVFALPNEAERILRIDHPKGEASLVGPKLPAEYISAAVMGEFVYGVPTGKVGVAGRLVRIKEGSEQVDLVGPEMSGEEYGLCVASGGCIYCFPRRSNNVLRVYDGGGGTTCGERLRLEGPQRCYCCAVAAGAGAAAPAAAAADGERIYALPHRAGRLLRITASPPAPPPPQPSRGGQGPRSAAPSAAAAPCSARAAHPAAAFGDSIRPRTGASAVATCNGGMPSTPLCAGREVRGAGGGSYLVEESAGRFQPAQAWLGRKKGWVFKTGAKGLGYYPDETSAQAANQLDLRTDAAAPLLQGRCRPPSADRPSAFPRFDSPSDFLVAAPGDRALRERRASPPPRDTPGAAFCRGITGFWGMFFACGARDPLEGANPRGGAFRGG